MLKDLAVQEFFSGTWPAQPLDKCGECRDPSALQGRENLTLTDVQEASFAHSVLFAALCISML